MAVSLKLHRAIVASVMTFSRHAIVNRANRTLCGYALRLICIAKLAIIQRMRWLCATDVGYDSHDDILTNPE